MATAAFTVLLTSFQTAKGIVHKVIKGVLHFAGIAKYLYPCISKFLLGAHTHSAGNNMCHLVFEDLINRDTPSASMHCGIGNDLCAGDFPLFFIYIREKEKLALSEVRRSPRMIMMDCCP